MKTKLLLLVMLLVLKLPVFAQNKVVKYCEVIVWRYGFTDKIKAEISTGKVDSLFTTNANLKSQLQKVNTLKTVSDILNYMSSIGWSLTPLTSGERIYFKKEFDPLELNPTKTQ